MQAIFKAVQSAPMDLKSGPWTKISTPAKDIVRKMLTRDPKRRLTAEEVRLWRHIVAGGEER